MANFNVATLMLWRGEDPAEALSVAEVVLRWWRSSLKDLWNVVAVSTGVGEGQDVTCAGQPWSNSHYGYYMVAWHLLFALSGQEYDAPAQALRFAPALQPPYRLPVLVPRTTAQLTAEVLSARHGHIKGESARGTTSAMRYSLSVVAGAPLVLRFLSVGGSAAAGPWPRQLAAGETITFVSRPRP